MFRRLFATGSPAFAQSWPPRIARPNDLNKNKAVADAQKSAATAQELAGQLNKLQKEVDQYTLRTATALWVEETFPLRRAFLDTAAAHFGGAAFPIDFKHNISAAADQINRWVETQTDDHIKALISPDALTGDARLVITSAIYFKGQWNQPFTASATKDEDFLLATGNKRRTPMMHQYSLVNYAAFQADGSLFNTPLEILASTSANDPSLYPDAQGFTMVQLPYKGGKLAMVLIVPQSADGLDELEQKLTYDNLTSWISASQRRTVDLAVPKFKLAATYQLKDSLKQLGMVRAFNDPQQKDPAQFDDLVESQDLAHKLFIDDVVHKTFVEVNEKGTEAAAATAVTMVHRMTAARHPSVPFIPRFRADKPFVLVIRDTDSGNILFFGRVVNPNS
jgi:serpin B